MKQSYVPSNADNTDQSHQKIRFVAFYTENTLVHNFLLLLKYTNVEANISHNITHSQIYIKKGVKQLFRTCLTWGEESGAILTLS